MFIKSPLNYTGNKYRILPQITKYFPKHTKVFVDMFCGGATVGFNVSADKVFLIDCNPRVINLLKFLASKDINAIIDQISGYVIPAIDDRIKKINKELGNI